MKMSPTRRFIKGYALGGRVSLIKGQDSSGVLKSMIGCNCFIDVPAASQGLRKNECVDVVLI